MRSNFTGSTDERMLYLRSTGETDQGYKFAFLENKITLQLAKAGTPGAFDTIKEVALTKPLDNNWHTYKVVFDGSNITVYIDPRFYVKQF